MVRGCKAKIVKNAAATQCYLRSKGDPIDKSYKTQEETDLVEAITAQRKEAERQRLKSLGLKRPWKVNDGVPQISGG